jgi:hypothetical protein
VAGLEFLQTAPERVMCEAEKVKPRCDGGPRMMEIPECGMSAEKSCLPKRETM